MSAKLSTRLPKISGELAFAVDKAIVQGAHLVATDAEVRLGPHKESGELELQVHVEDREREGVYVLAGDPSDPSFAFYGHMLEHGTSHSAPHPFLVPALEANADTIERMARAAVRSVS